MKIIKITILFVCMIMIFTCMTLIFAEEDDIAYTPEEATEYEGYELGTNGIITIIFLSIAIVTITILYVRHAVKNGVYN